MCSVCLVLQCLLQMGLSDNSVQLDFAKYCTNITRIDNISQADMSAQATVW